MEAVSVYADNQIIDVVRDFLEQVRNFGDVDSSPIYNTLLVKFSHGAVSSWTLPEFLSYICNLWAIEAITMEELATIKEATDQLREKNYENRMPF